LEMCNGHLFDLGPDGLGFILEEGVPTRAFIHKNLEHPLADSGTEFAALEGSPVKFSVIDGQIRDIKLCAVAIKGGSAVAAAGSSAAGAAGE